MMKSGMLDVPAEEESRSTAARPEVTAFTEFLPKPTAMLMQGDFSLRVFAGVNL